MRSYEVKIDDKYFIDTDENNYRLNEVKVTGDKSKNSGELYTVIQGYYGSLDSALKAYVRYSMRELPESVESVIEKLNELEANIVAMCKGIKDGN